MADSLSLIASNYSDSDEEINYNSTTTVIHTNTTNKFNSIEATSDSVSDSQGIPIVNVQPMEIIETQNSSQAVVNKITPISDESVTSNEILPIDESTKINNDKLSSMINEQVQSNITTKNTEIHESSITIVEELIKIDSGTGNVVYRNKTSDNESDSEEDSSSSSSSSSPVSNASDDESSESEAIHNGKIKATNRNGRRREKGEYDDLPPIEDLKISVAEVLCDPMGEVGWIVEQMVIVTPKPMKPTLNFNTVLFIEKGKRVLGKIFDIFGPVAEPHYCVRFNNAEHIENSNITPGMTVYYCPNTEHTSLVFMTDLLKMKAAEDVDEDEHPDFSDDEEEKAYYAALRQKQAASKSSTIKNPQNVPSKRARTTKNSNWKSNHPWNNEMRFRQHHHQQQQQPQNCYNNQLQNNWPIENSYQNNWSYPTNNYNPWTANNPTSYENWQQMTYNSSSNSHYPPLTSHPNVNSPRAQFSWPASLTFTPTQPTWHVRPPPPPPPPGM